MKHLKWIFFIFLSFSFFSFKSPSLYKEATMQDIDSTSVVTLEVVNRFNEAFNKHDVDAIMNLMTEDCIFENTRPVPDGERIVGQEKVRTFWEELFKRSPHAQFEAEEIFAAGDRCVVRWIYTWIKDGKKGHVRGVDIFKIHKGKVAEKFSYVKG